jgi:hypothetical protein
MFFFKYSVHSKVLFVYEGPENDPSQILLRLVLPCPRVCKFICTIFYLLHVVYIFLPLEPPLIHTL